jgi:hypothetical protein
MRRFQGIGDTLEDGQQATIHSKMEAIQNATW